MEETKIITKNRIKKKSCWRIAKKKTGSVGFQKIVGNEKKVSYIEEKTIGRRKKIKIKISKVTSKETPFCSK